MGGTPAPSVPPDRGWSLDDPRHHRPPVRRPTPSGMLSACASSSLPPPFPRRLPCYQCPPPLDPGDTGDGATQATRTRSTRPPFSGRIRPDDSDGPRWAQTRDFEDVLLGADAWTNPSAVRSRVRSRGRAGWRGDEPPRRPKKGIPGFPSEERPSPADLGEYDATGTTGERRLTLNNSRSDPSVVLNASATRRWLRNPCTPMPAGACRRE